MDAIRASLSHSLGSSGKRRWKPVEVGRSGAAVYRSHDARVYAKAVPAKSVDELRLERDSIAWLATTSIPGPRVVDWTESDAGAVLVMTTVQGVPACDVGGSVVDAAVSSMAEVLARMHAVPVDGCPFVRCIDVTVAAAADAAGRGTVDTADFDDARSGRSVEDLLAELVAGQPRARDLEGHDLVVCHGDPCLPNLMIDPETGHCTGLIDLGRLGVADRYLDLALTTRSMSAPDINPQYNADDAAMFLHRYRISEPDQWRLDYYRLLDEFS